MSCQEIYRRRSPACSAVVLKKIRKRRLSSIADARLELEEREPVREVSPTPSLPARQRSLLSHWWPALVGIAITAAAAAALWPSAPVSTNTGVSRLSILAPPGEQVYPDSTAVAVSARRHDGGLRRRDDRAIGK
jgi:hypothetical protein